MPCPHHKNKNSQARSIQQSCFSVPFLFSDSLPLVSFISPLDPTFLFLFPSSLFSLGPSEQHLTSTNLHVWGCLSLGNSFCCYILDQFFQKSMDLLKKHLSHHNHACNKFTQTTRQIQKTTETNKISTKMSSTNWNKKSNNPKNKTWHIEN